MKLPRSGPQPAVAGGHRAGRRGAPADDPHPRVRRAPSRCGRRRHAHLISRVASSDSARFVQGIPDPLAVADGAAHRLAASPTTRFDPTDPAGRRRRRHARGDQGRRRRLGRTAGARPRSAGQRSIRATFLRRGDEAIVELATASGLALGQRRSATRGRVDLWHGPGSGRRYRPGRARRRARTGRQRHDGRWLRSARRARCALPGRARQRAATGGGALGASRESTCRTFRRCCSEVSLTIASDVTNPLLGERGAAAVYGPQKGANKRQVLELDAALAHYADVLEAATGRAIRAAPARARPVARPQACSPSPTVRIVRDPARRRGADGADRLRRGPRGL